MLVILGYCVYVFAGQQLELNAVKRDTEATRVKLEELKQTNMVLNQEKERLSTQTYVEKIARDELGMVKPGEVPYISTEGN
ncbi:MAG: Septum formation initiator [Firmicutes bacterium]|nr:Septum formation initiator [Bacillota bacterium]